MTTHIMDLSASKEYQCRECGCITSYNLLVERDHVWLADMEDVRDHIDHFTDCPVYQERLNAEKAEIDEAQEGVREAEMAAR